MKVLLVELNDEQIRKAKVANGARKQITHAVVCGEYGQIFGTEKKCRKYYSAWSEIFPKLFDGGKEEKGHEPASYESTFDLVNILIAAHDSLEEKSETRQIPSAPQSARLRKKGFLEKLFGK
ncbi:MAG: hypothetical protein CME72_10955 [Halomonadaceae bacterium]|nr:hypothetical protein [Halomonadaceae bacterium]